MRSLFDLHVHSSRGSPDSSLYPDDLVAEVWRLGITGAMVTEHNGWPRHDFERYTKDLDGVVLVRALEVYTPLGHVIAMGLDHHVTGMGGGVEVVRQLRKEVDKVGGYLILAHPFRFLFDPPGIYSQNKLFEDPAAIPRTAEQGARHPVFELVDDVEVVNGGNLENENRFAQEVVRVLGKSGTGGSDAHSVNGLAKGITVFNGEIRSERDLLDALRAGDFYAIEGFHVGKPSYYGMEPDWEPSALGPES